MRTFRQFQGIESWVRARSVGAVGDLPQAAMVPISETTSSTRAMSWRDMEVLQLKGFASMVKPVRAGVLTRHVTFCHVM